MRLTPPALRGALYPGLLTKSCFEYSPCSVCRLCTQYDPNAATCTYCEGRKPAGFGHHCTCTEAKRLILKQLQDKIKRPLSMMPSQSAGNTDMEVAGNVNNEEMIRRVAKEFYVDTEVTTCP